MNKEASGGRRFRDGGGERGSDWAFWVFCKHFGLFSE